MNHGTSNSANGRLIAHYPDLRGRSVFISGGATGIGAALVEAFALQGCRVSFVDIDQAASTSVVEELNESDVSAFHCDITDTEAYTEVIDLVNRTRGPVSILINNAANDHRHHLSEIDSDAFDQLIAVNLKHMLFAAKAVARNLKSGERGSIINFGSIGWMTGATGYPVYATSKAAVHGLTRSLAREFGPEGIRVNTLVPGWVMTDKQIRLWVDDDARAEIQHNQCLPGFVEPRHIAQMALFLGSDVSQMCTAQNFIVDGGWS